MTKSDSAPATYEEALEGAGAWMMTFTFTFDEFASNPASWTPVEGAWPQEEGVPEAVYEALNKGMADLLAAGKVERDEPILCHLGIFRGGALEAVWKLDLEVGAEPAQLWPFEIACIFCHCTESWGCDEGCCWVDDEKGRAVCSVCDERVVELVERLRRFLGEVLRGEARPFAVMLLCNLLRRFQMEATAEAGTVFVGLTRWYVLETIDEEGDPITLWRVIDEQDERGVSEAHLLDLVEDILTRVPRLDPDDPRWEVR